MTTTSNQIKSDPIKTDDLAFSAYLRMKGIPLVKLENRQSKQIFYFDLTQDALVDEKLNFINSDMLKFYNEIRNLKKLIG
ncbi:DUF5659 domain-containing protein [bacterium]